MSIFFSQIKKVFKDQNKENDFKIDNNHYIDQTFCFNSKDIDSNCFLSNNDDENFELLKDFKDFKIEWEKSKYIINQNHANFKQNLMNAFKKIQKSIELKDEIKTEEIWIKNWNNYLTSKRNEKRKKFSEKQIEKLKQIMFDEMYIPQIKDKFNNGNKVNNYLKEYEKIFEWKRISETNDYKKYKMFKDKSDKKGKIDCTNIEQGNLGTCYFLETLSTLSNYGQLIVQLFPNEYLNDKGIYEIFLFLMENGKKF